MRPIRKRFILCALVFLTSCHEQSYAPPEAPMPPNTVLLSQMMRELSAQPGFTEAMLKELDPKAEQHGKKGPALLTPRLIDELRKRILGQNWGGLDRFPGWTMGEINPTVRVIGHEAGKSSELETTAAVHPGATATAANDKEAREYLDLGPYSLGKAETASLDEPSTLPGFTTEGIVTTLGDGVVRGDGPNDLAPEHAESQRLADVLNRLAANALDGAAQTTVRYSENTVSTPADLVRAFAAAGEQITVDDARYFANFGHFHYKGQDVMMPFYVDSEITIPHSHDRKLLVPVSHAEYEWHIRAPQGKPGINADVSYYFGIDGKSEWRTMDTLDQAWVLKRNAHEYTGAQAVEVTRLASLLTVAYMHQHERRPALPFGGYYALGVCQDGVSAIEHKMTGAVTLFPNTADATLFNDPRDAEVNALIAAIPKGREGAKPEPGRIFGSLPTAPATSGSGPYDAVTIPGLAADLNATYAGWQEGTLDEARTHKALLKAIVFFASAALVALYFAVITLRFQNRHGRQRPTRR